MSRLATKPNYKLAQYASDGYSCKEMAIPLGLDHRQCQHHLNRLRDIHRARTITHLIAILIRQKIIT